MGVFYSLHGSITVHPGSEVEEILDRFIDEAGEISIADEIENDDGTLTIFIDGGQDMSYMTVQEIDSILQELGPYVTTPTNLQYECGGEFGELYIGPADQEKKTEESKALERAKQMVDDLSYNNVDQLLTYILEIQSRA